LYKEREFNLAEKYNMKEILKKVDPFMLVERERERERESTIWLKSTT